MKKYEVEREGQLEFFNDYIKLVDKNLTEEDIINDNNDGVVNGNIIEFKLQINNLNAVLFQTIKYLSSLRIKGKPVPGNIILVSLNESKCYIYHSEDYIEDIEKVYNRAASTSNDGFKCNQYNEVLDYGNSDIDEARLIEILREKKWTKINIDENCIVGWATKYYNENKSAKKSDFIGDTEGKVKIIGEIRKPTYFKEFINPYTGKTNEKFKYLMDKLNDTIQKKELGAFYTSQTYADKSLELLRKAIERVPDGKDYIILDRCAGTGNLERHLTDEELGHCVLSTVEYYEYKVLVETLGDKVKHIIPPTEKDDTFNKGLVRGADALSEEYLNNQLIKKYIDDPNCIIIMFENPPYAEAHGSEKKMNGNWKNSYLCKQMKSKIKGNASDDIGNIFIWSAFEYYLKKPEDSYIVYSPVKYWKSQNLVNKKFAGGFGFNRRHFHTIIDACIMCALWYNIDDATTEEITIKGYDIDKDGNLIYCRDLSVKKIHRSFSQEYYDKRKFEDDEPGIACYSDGLEQQGKSLSLDPKYNQNIIGYLAPKGNGFDKPDLNCTLTTCAFYNAHGFYLRNDNYLEKLPMFCASRYITYNREWTERARIMKSGDGSKQFKKDINSQEMKKFLMKCLIFTTLEMQNHCRSFIGSDGRIYINNLCLDVDTLSYNYINSCVLDDSDKEIIEQWEKVLSDAKKTKNYNKDFKYGVYQIYDELNTYTKDPDTGEIKFDYSSLNGNLLSLKSLIKKYYLSEIVPMLFKYEFLK